MVEEEHTEIHWAKIICNMIQLMEEVKNLTKAFLKDMAFAAVNDQDFSTYQRGSTLLVYKFSDKKRQGSGTMNTRKKATVRSKTSTTQPERGQAHQTDRTISA